MLNCRNSIIEEQQLSFLRRILQPLTSRHFGYVRAMIAWDRSVAERLVAENFVLRLFLAKTNGCWTVRPESASYKKRFRRCVELSSKRFTGREEGRLGDRFTVLTVKPAASLLPYMPLNLVGNGPFHIY